MAKPPFRVGASPARNVNAPAPRPAPPAGKAAQHAEPEGETLVEAGVEVGPPADAVGQGVVEGGRDRGEGHPQRPEHRPAIPWPAAEGPARKPFKLG